LTTDCQCDINFAVIVPDSPSPHSAEIPSNEPSAPADSARSKPLLDLFTQITALGIQLRQRSDLPHAESAVLEILARFGELTVPQIARVRCTSRQNIQILIDRLEGIGRVELNENPAHRKSSLVRLTPLGKASLETSESVQKDLLHSLGTRISEAEIRGAVSVLSKVRSLLGVVKEETANEAESRPSTGTAKTAKPKEEPNPGTESQTEEFPLNLL
jgi:DNA-binding MarR family transcriptional regulator